MLWWVIRTAMRASFTTAHIWIFQRLLNNGILCQMINNAPFRSCIYIRVGHWEVAILTSFAGSSVLTVLGAVCFDHFIFTIITFNGKVHGNWVVAWLNNAQNARNSLFFLFQWHLPCQLVHQFALDDATCTIEKQSHHFEEAWFAVITGCGVAPVTRKNGSCLTLGFGKTLTNFSRKVPQHCSRFKANRFYFHRENLRLRPDFRRTADTLKLRCFRSFDWLWFVLDMPFCFGGVRGFSQWNSASLYIGLLRSFTSDVSWIAPKYQCPRTAFGHRHMRLDVDWYESVISKKAVENSGWDILNVIFGHKNITRIAVVAQGSGQEFPTSSVFGRNMPGWVRQWSCVSE